MTRNYPGEEKEIYRENNASLTTIRSGGEMENLAYWRN